MNMTKIIPLILTNTTVPSSVPSDYGMGDLVDILFWIARTLVIAVGGGVGLFKITSGKSNEDPKETNQGLAALVAGGVLFTATFAIEAAF